MRPTRIAAFCLAVAAAAPAQQGPSMADRLLNDPRVDALRPYGQRIPPEVRADGQVQFGRALRFRLTGHSDFWRIGVTSPTVKPVRKGDRIVIAFWAKAGGTEDGAPGRIGRVQLEATPVVRAVFEQPFDIGPEWRMHQLKGVADRDYPAGALNAAMHLDAKKQVLDLGPLFVFNYGRAE